MLMPKELQLAELPLVTLLRPVDMALCHFCFIAEHSYLDTFAILCLSSYKVLFNNLWSFNFFPKRFFLSELPLVTLLRPVVISTSLFCFIAEHSYLDIFAILCLSAYLVLFNNLWVFNVNAKRAAVS